MNADAKTNELKVSLNLRIGNDVHGACANTHTRTHTFTRWLNAWFVLVLVEKVFLLVRPIFLGVKLHVMSVSGHRDKLEGVERHL